MRFLRAVAVWLLILLLAIANGALREGLLLPRLGLPAAQIVSGLLLVAAILVTARLLVPRLPAVTGGQRLSVGVLWLGLTLAFEFAFGRLMQHKDWSDLLAAYTFRDGNLWPIVLLVTLVAPSVVGRRRAGT